MYYVRSTDLETPPITTSIDFNIKIDNDEILSVDVGFTVKDDILALNKTTEAMFILDNGSELHIKDVKIRFIDRKKVESRYFGYMTPADYKTMIQQDEPKLKLIIKGKEYILEPSKKFLDQINNAETQFIY